VKSPIVLRKIRIHRERKNFNYPSSPGLKKSRAFGCSWQKSRDGGRRIFKILFLYWFHDVY